MQTTVYIMFSYSPSFFPDRLSPELEKVVMFMMEPEYGNRASASALLELPIIKRKRRYNALSKYLSKKVVFC